jgi:sugar/nucleoside kinase (ribokinase family)
MNSQPVLIVGSIALDTIESPAGQRDSLIGGSATYATVAAGRSVPVHVVGVVGTDFPAVGMDLFQRYARDLTDLAIVEGKTFRWGGRYHANWDDRDTLFTELGVFDAFEPNLSTVNRKIPIQFLANIHPQLQLAVLRQSEDVQWVVVDTMNLWIDTTLEELHQVLKQAHVLLINESELWELTSKTRWEPALAAIRELGPRVVVVKQGSKGAFLMTEDETFRIGAYPATTVVDPTGAGDTFGGGFVAALARGESWDQALVRGSALASICVEGFGVEALLACSEKELQRRVAYLQTTLKP